VCSANTRGELEIPGKPIDCTFGEPLAGEFIWLYRERVLAK